jgi:Tol biopolymer transport system component
MSRDVFISHASEDHTLAEQVCGLLEQRGLHCWIAPRDVGVGAEWDEAILDAIERSRAYLLILSTRANNSSFVKNELNRAFSCGKAIVTFRIEDVLPGRSLELYLARHHWTDAFPPPLEPKVDQLASSLTRLLNPSTDGSAEAPPVAVVSAPKPARGSALVSRIVGLASGRVSMAAFAVAVVVATAFAIPAMRYLSATPPPSLPETRVDIVTPATDDPTSFALSPDGLQLVFAASNDGVSNLWLRSLATTKAQPLAGTEGARDPFWAPDGSAIAFFAGDALKRFDLGSRTSRILTPAGSGRGGTWSKNGVILFTPNTTSPLMQVSAAGGIAVPVTTLGPGQQHHRWPHFLPDGRRFLFFVQGRPNTAGIYLGTLDGGVPTRLTPADSAGIYLTAGWLLWVQAGTLFSQRLDLEHAALTEESVKVADNVAVDVARHRAAVSASATGIVAYRTGVQRQLLWVDRSGTARGSLGDPDNSLNNPRVSPDGRRAVVVRTVLGNTDLWILDGARMSRLTFNAARDDFPLWFPDSTRIVFISNRGGAVNLDLYQKLASGAGVEDQLLASDQTKVPTSWSADGRFLLYSSIDPQTNFDLWVVPMAGERMPWVFLRTPFLETQGAFSPDGRWVAYQSNESGRPEIYVRPFVAPGAAVDAPGAAEGQWQVSTAGGIYPVWRSDGKEIYFIDPAGAMMAVSISVNGSMLEPGEPVRLFPMRIIGGGVDALQGRQYDLAPDGRFLINTVLDDAAAPITLIQNWNPEATQ